MKGVIDEIDAEIRRLSNEVRTRSTYRPVECERQYRYTDCIYREIRLDTEDVIAERKLTTAEQQMELDFKAASNGVPADESWKAVRIIEAMPTLGKKVFDGMAKADLETMGQLLDWKNAKPDRFWTDIEGLGKAGCDKIDDAIEAFFAGRAANVTDDDAA
jgi:hypothetical protein